MAQRKNGVLKIGRPRERTTVVPQGHVQRTREAAVRAAQDAVPNGRSATDLVPESAWDHVKGLSMIRGTDPKTSQPMMTLDVMEHLNIPW